MAAVLLDTTVLIDLLRGRPRTAERLRSLRASGDTVHTCAVNVEETVRGLRPDELESARRLFAGLRTAPLGESEGWTAGEWRRDFATRGQTLAQADCLIAAAAATISARLATGNPKDFPFAELVVEHWKPGL
jgi:predicted nucleic acid-binding protein